MGGRAAKILAVLFFVFVLVVIYWASSGRMPIFLQRLYRFPGGDKLAHFLLVGCLALLVNLALGRRMLTVGRRRFLTGSVLVAAFISLEEVSQFAFPLRTLDVWDWAAGMAGILLAGRLTGYISFWRTSVRRPPQA